MNKLLLEEDEHLLCLWWYSHEGLCALSLDPGFSYEHESWDGPTGGPLGTGGDPEARGLV